MEASKQKSKFREWTKTLAPYKKQGGFLFVAILSIGSFLWVGINHGWWQAGVTVLAISIVITIVPIVLSFLGFAELNDPGEWFDSADQLGGQKQRVMAQYTRIKGTLRFWKNKAAAHHRLHLARVIWSLISGVSLPVLVQRYDKADVWSTLFMTMLTSWTGFIVALAYTFKSEEKYQGFRQHIGKYLSSLRKLDHLIAPKERFKAQL
jgi:hypothetical protein